MDEVDALDGDVPEGIRVKALSTQVLHRLITEWSTDDAVLGETLRQIAAVPETAPERHDMEAFLHMTQARAAWRKADELRAQLATNARRTERIDGMRAADGRRKWQWATCAECGVQTRLRQDGNMREHDRGSQVSAFHRHKRDRCPGSSQPPKP